MTYFIGETAAVYEYYQLNDKYFSSGIATTTYIDNKDLDFSSEDTQKKLLTFYSNLEACTECSENWFMPNTLNSWYESFHDWTKSGGCAPRTPASSSDSYVVPQEDFYPCLELFLNSNRGRLFKKDIIFDTSSSESSLGRITGFRQSI